MARKRTAGACRISLTEWLRPGLFRALADPNRLVLIGRLAAANGAMTVTETAECCGVHISGASRHLAALRDEGIVTARKRGREVAYRLNTEALVRYLRDLADVLEACCGGSGAKAEEGEANGQTRRNP